MRKGVTQGAELCKEGYAISKPQGKGLTVLLQTPSRDRRRDSILGPFFLHLLSKVLLGVKMRVLRVKKRAFCGGISSIPISC